MRRAFFVLACALCLVSCGGGAARSGGPGAAPASSVQDFQLDDLQGKRWQLSDHLGKKVILLHFWATWCEPCKTEMPHIADLYKKHKDRGFLVLAISIDGPESIAQVRGDAEQLKMPFPVLLDQETKVVAAYNPRRSAPYLVLIGRDGRLVRSHEGHAAGDEGPLARWVEEELAR